MRAGVTRVFGLVKGAAVAEQHLPRWSAVHEDNCWFLRQRKIRGDRVPVYMKWIIEISYNSLYTNILLIID
jgi:hypothetical protein